MQNTTDFSYGTPIKIKNYLPNTLRNMSKLTPKRQLVLDVEQSSMYLDEFPILTKQKDFARLWSTFSTTIRQRIDTDYKYSDKPEFISDWNQFSIEIDLRVQQFVSTEITTIPQRVMLLWQEQKDRLHFVLDFLPYEMSLFFDYLNSVLAPSKQNIWEDFSDTIESVLDDYIRPHILTQSVIREIVPESDQQVINLTARMLGFNFRDELLNAFGKDRVAAIIPILGETYKIASTDDFIKLVELTVGSTVLVEHLYSIDYINFVTYKRMLGKGGEKQHEDSSTNDWFKTTHVNLFVEYSNARYLATSINAKLGTTLLEIIEHFIPANLVLKNFGLMYAVNTRETAPGFFLSSKMANRSGYRRLGTQKIQTPPLVQQKPPVEALIFDTKNELLDFIKTYFEPDSKSMVANFLPFGATMLTSSDWTAHATKNDAISSNTRLGTLGLASITRTENFEFESTLFSASSTEKYIGLVAAQKPPDEKGFVEGNKNSISIQFMRTPGAANNWLVNFSDGQTVSRLANGTNSVTGYNSATGWKNVYAKIKIVREKNIVRAYTTKFDLLSNRLTKPLLFEPSTEIILDLSTTTNTRKLMGKQRYGFITDRQEQASFEDIKFVGEQETNSLFCLADNTKYTYSLVQKRWLIVSNYEFRDYFAAKTFFINPVTQVLYYLNGTKVISRITPYI